MSRALDLKTLQDEIDGIVERFSEKAKPIKGSDVNNTDTTGFYQGDGKESKDLPTDGKYNLIVVANPDGSTSQLYIDLKTNKMYVRNKVDGKWQDWQPMLDGRDYAKLTTDINNILNKLVITNDINSNSTTDIASSKAVKTAYDKGVEALNAAQKAQNTANSATSKADQALNTLNSKQDKINISDSVSSTSHTDAASSYAVKLAYDKACSAQNSASSAQSTANSAQSTASSAYNLASSVQSTASSAYNRANEAFQSASDGKSQIAGAINSKGGSASSSDSFYTLASEIRNIKTTSTTVSSATGNASCSDVLEGRTFSNSNGNGYSGTMSNRGYLSVSPKEYSQSFDSGYYSGVNIGAADAPVAPTVSGKKYATGILYGNRRDDTTVDNLDFKPQTVIAKTRYEKDDEKTWWWYEVIFMSDYANDVNPLNSMFESTFSGNKVHNASKSGRMFQGGFTINTDRSVAYHWLAIE